MSSCSQLIKDLENNNFKTDLSSTGLDFQFNKYWNQVVQHGKINSMSQTIDIQHISKGSYFLQIDKSTAKAIKIAFNL